MFPHKGAVPFSQYFDKNTGINRAATYLAVLQCCQSELQLAILFYTILTSNQGETLQKTIVSNMNIGDKETTLAILGKYIYEHAAENDKSFIKESLIGKLGVFANAGEQPEENNPKLIEVKAVFNELERRVGSRVTI